MTTDMDKLIADIEGLRIGRQPRPDAPFDAYIVSANNKAIDDCIALIRKHQAEQQGVDLLEAIKALAPFEVVQGDVVHRTNPSSQQVVNSNAAWAVSNSERSAHKIRKHVDALNAAADNVKWKE